MNRTVPKIIVISVHTVNRFPLTTICDKVCQCVVAGWQLSLSVCRGRLAAFYVSVSWQVGSFPCQCVMAGWQLSLSVYRGRVAAFYVSVSWQVGTFLCQFVVTGWQLSSGTPTSTIDKTSSHNITEMLYTVALTLILLIKIQTFAKLEIISLPSTLA